MRGKDACCFISSVSVKYRYWCSTGIPLLHANAPSQYRRFVCREVFLPHFAWMKWNLYERGDGKAISDVQWYRRYYMREKDSEETGVLGSPVWNANRHRGHLCLRFHFTKISKYMMCWLLKGYMITCLRTRPTKMLFMFSRTRVAFLCLWRESVKMSLSIFEPHHLEVTEEDVPGSLVQNRSTP